MGRRKKYSDPEQARAAKREQWRSYYARNTQRLRAQAKERMANRRVKLKCKSSKNASSESKLLPAVFKLTKGSMVLDSKISLAGLYDALSGDIVRWRTRATDEEEWRALTDRALRTAANHTELDALERAFNLKSQRAAAATKIARAAEDEALRRNPSDANTAARTRFAQLARYAAVIDNGVGELLLCARAGDGMLQRCFDEKSLIWQTSL